MTARTGRLFLLSAFALGIVGVLLAAAGLYAGPLLGADLSFSLRIQGVLLGCFVAGLGVVFALHAALAECRPGPDAKTPGMERLLKLGSFALLAAAFACLVIVVREMPSGAEVARAAEHGQEAARRLARATTEASAVTLALGTGTLALAALLLVVALVARFRAAAAGPELADGETTRIRKAPDLGGAAGS